MLEQPVLVVGLVGLGTLEDVGSAGFVGHAALFSGLGESACVFGVALFLLLQGLWLGGGFLGLRLYLGGHQYFNFTIFN